MTPTELAATILLGSGVVLGVLIFGPVRAQRCHARERVEARVRVAPDGAMSVLPTARPATPAPLVRPATRARVVLHDGDLLEVYPRNGEMVPFSRLLQVLVHGYLVLAVLLAAAGIRLLTLGSGPFDDSSDAVRQTLAVLFLSAFAPLGVAMLAHLVESLRGSFKVSGTVVEVGEIHTSRKTAYQPLVEYHAEAGTRRAWGSPRFFRPDIGDAVTIRVSPRAQGQAVITSPLAVAGTLLILLVGLTGVGWIVRLLVP